MFSGADASLLNSKNGGIWADPKALRTEFWDTDPAKRRQMLMPFFWGTVAKQGQVFGNQRLGSTAHVTNGMAFSYPGYNEMLTGHPDPKINSNEFGTNPNLTVFEWLNRTPEFQGKVAVFGTWNVFTGIFNQERSHLFMQTGWNLTAEVSDSTPRSELLARIFKTTTRMDEDDTYDAFLQVPLLDYIHAAHPRVLFVGYGETDNWAHSGRYDLVLESCKQFDGFVEELWKTMQAMPEYRDQTTFIITTDHGRGHGLTQWKEHGIEYKGSENIWMGVIGPDTQPLGERSHTADVTQAQIASTVAALLGQDFQANQPLVAPPLTQVLAPVGEAAAKP